MTALLQTRYVFEFIYMYSYTTPIHTAT